MDPNPDKEHPMRVTFSRTPSRRNIVTGARIVLGCADRVIYSDSSNGPDAYEAARDLKARAVEIAEAHPALTSVEVYAPKSAGGFTVSVWERAELVDDQD